MGDKKYKGTRGQGDKEVTILFAYVIDDVILSCRCDAPVDLLSAELRATGRRAVGRVRGQLGQWAVGSRRPGSRPSVRPLHLVSSASISLNRELWYTRG